MLHSPINPSQLGAYKLIQHLSDVTQELMAQDGSTIFPHRRHILPYYTKEPIIFPYFSQYHSTSSLLSNPDTDFYHDISSNSTQHGSDTPFESFNHTRLLKPLSSPQRFYIRFLPIKLFPLPLL